MVKFGLIWLIFLGFATTSFSQSKAFDDSMKPILSAYLTMQESLANDDLNGVKQAADEIKMAAEKLSPRSVQGSQIEQYRNLPSNLIKQAEAIESAKNIDSVREQFKKLSQSLAMWAGIAKPKGVNVMYCPMVKANWLQNNGTVANPYYGKKMLTCGEVIK